MNVAYMSIFANEAKRAFFAERSNARDCPRSTLVACKVSTSVYIIDVDAVVRRFRCGFSIS